MADFIRAGIQYHDQSIALLHGGSYTLLQSLVVLFSGNHHLVDNHFNVVVLVTVQFHAVCNFAYLAIHTDIQIPFLSHLLEEFLVMPLSGTDKRCQHIDTLALILVVNEVQNLLFGVFDHLFA